MDACKPGADVFELCVFGTEQATKELMSVYKKKKDMVKGMAFPVCISVNDCCGHFSPMKDESYKL